MSNDSAVKILFEDGRVRLSAHGTAIWTTESEALMLAHALTERLSPPHRTGARILYERGFGPGDGDSHVIPPMNPRHRDVNP